MKRWQGDHFKSNRDKKVWTMAREKERKRYKGERIARLAARNPTRDDLCDHKDDASTFLSLTLLFLFIFLLSLCSVTLPHSTLLPRPSKVPSAG